MAGTHRVRRIDYAKVSELYWEGASDREIADAFKCAPRTISEWRQRQKLPANAGHGKPIEIKPAKKQRQITPLEQDAIDARKAGMTYGQYKAQQYLELQKRNKQLPALRKNGGRK